MVLWKKWCRQGISLLLKREAAQQNFSPYLRGLCSSRAQWKYFPRAWWILKSSCFQDSLVIIWSKRLSRSQVHLLCILTRNSVTRLKTSKVGMVRTSRMPLQIMITATILGRISIEWLSTLSRLQEMKPMERAALPKSCFLQSLNHRAQAYQVVMVPQCQTATMGTDREDCLIQTNLAIKEIASSQSLIKHSVMYRYKRISMRVRRANLLESGSLIGSKMSKNSRHQIPHRKWIKTLDFPLMNRALKSIFQDSSTWAALWKFQTNLK